MQLHFVQVDEAPDMFRRLAAVGITTREACGNSVRNVTACPLAGVCRTEAFDVTPYAKAVAFYLLGHRDTQDFGRKFKIAFSGCEHEACALVSIHDLGGIAKVQDGKRGFALYVAGGLGAVPHQAKLFEAFVPEEDLLPLSRAICRVFARMGEKKARNKARLKFLVQKLGIEKFREIVQEEYRTHARRPDLAHVLRRGAAVRGEAGVDRRAAQRRAAARGLRRLGGHQRLRAAAERVRGRHRHLPAGRPVVRADPGRGRRGRAVRRRPTPAHDRAEHRAAVGAAQQAWSTCTPT